MDQKGRHAVGIIVHRAIGEWAKEKPLPETLYCPKWENLDEPMKDFLGVIGERVYNATVKQVIKDTEDALEAQRESIGVIIDQFKDSIENANLTAQATGRKDLQYVSLEVVEGMMIELAEKIRSGGKPIDSPN